MRILLVTALAMSLAGCSDVDFFGDSSAPAPREATAAPQPSVEASPAAEATNVAAAAPLPPVETRSEPAVEPAAAPPPAAMPAPSAAPSVQPPPPPSIAQTTPSSVHCSQLARLRSRDAAYAGEDGETQDAVYRKTYADCVAWDARHRL